MAKLLRVSDRHQVTLPADVLREAGVTEGSYVAVEARGGKIILEPKVMGEGSLSEHAWDALDRLVNKQVKAGRFTEYENPKEAKEHLKRAR